jgi:hypothetical protein
MEHSEPLIKFVIVRLENIQVEYVVKKITKSKTANYLEEVVIRGQFGSWKGSKSLILFIIYIILYYTVVFIGMIMLVGLN